jgi:hypothetical protein
MASPAFTKFDARAFLERETWKAAALMHAKAAEAPVQSAENRPTLAALAALAGHHAKIENSNQPPKRFTEAQNEQAAVVEPDAHGPHTWSEAVAKLDPGEPPIDVPTKRWMRFIDDCRLFLDGGDAARAFALGWGALDLFGCDRERPFARIDHMGLLWLINGGALFELHRDRALFTTERGARQSFRRRPVEVGSTALPWNFVGTSRPVPDGAREGVSKTLERSRP